MKMNILMIVCLGLLHVIDASAMDDGMKRKRRRATSRTTQVKRDDVVAMEEGDDETGAPVDETAAELDSFLNTMAQGASSETPDEQVMAPEQLVDLLISKSNVGQFKSRKSMLVWMQQLPQDQYTALRNKVICETRRGKRGDREVLRLLVKALEDSSAVEKQALEVQKKTLENSIKSSKRQRNMAIVGVIVTVVIAIATNLWQHYSE